MARVNFRQIQDRFSHIDARFVGSSCCFPEATARFDVDVYPWWEHPLYIEAVRTGKRWGFADVPDAAYKRVTVHAVGLREAKLTQGCLAIDWWFTQDDPLLWPFQNKGSIDCNQSLSVDRWLAILEDTRRALNLQSVNPILEGAPIENVWKYGSSSCFHLGRFPGPAFLEIRRQLVASGISIFVSREPTTEDIPVLFQVDGDDYIIADDFEVDVPEFDHNPEWFKP